MHTSWLMHWLGLLRSCPMDWLKRYIEPHWNYLNSFLLWFISLFFKGTWAGISCKSIGGRVIIVVSICSVLPSGSTLNFSSAQLDPFLAKQRFPYADTRCRSLHGAHRGFASVGSSCLEFSVWSWTIAWHPCKLSCDSEVEFISWIGTDWARWERTLQ